ncbi:MAG: restriction endonuclease subunit S [Desulfamplus sp.]|nr:restriction endonuclease subunit S [Desulfamplus sp.]
MTEQFNLLQKHFDTALESPDGIKKLRELILTLAMQGKLVKQDPNDQPASELLKEIQAEKERLIKEGKIKKQKELPPIKTEEVPYEVPKGWVWCKYDDVAVLQHGYQFREYDFIPNGIPVIKITQCKPNGVLDLRKCDFIDSKRVSEFKDILIHKGDLLMALTGGTLGKVTRVRQDYGMVVQNYRVGKFISNEIVLDMNFLEIILLSNLFQNLVKVKINQNAQPNIGKDNIENLPIPLPPLAEQKRIVAKINELMALCDKLESQHKARNEKRLALHTSAINRLLTAADKKEFDISWQFIAHHFDSLYSVKENVAELKKAILTLAMQGKLVKQDPKDQPASELLKEIQAEKERLIKKEGLRTTANPIISEDEKYLKTPVEWEFVRLGNIAKFIDYRGKTPIKVSVGVPLITAKNIRFGYIDREPYEYITEEDYGSWMTRGIPKIGDLLFTTEAPLGNIAIIDMKERFALAQRAICFQLHIAEMANFVRYLIMSDVFQEQLLINATGMTAKGIKSSRLKEVTIPLPPLAEQERIVAKIDELMALCDKLENQINQATAKQTALFDAVLAKV